METLHDRKMARSKGGQGGIPKYGEQSVAIKNVSNHLQSKLFLSKYNLPALPSTQH